MECPSHGSSLHSPIVVNGKIRPVDPVHYDDELARISQSKRNGTPGDS